ncbi:ParB/RepB/Spo0J family partition protein [Tautonia rosea]|uniref:ParB/RepB/Spo0J family partition protein n=1 Tax=Tautonia rosea TaxID=2728037 RepID=UPI00147563C6|nr:ParB/RepB/Spo0J family partition protein [Tautonia rosea]
MTIEQIAEIPLAEIELVPLLRKSIDEERLEGLMQSIREVGLLYPPRLTRRGEKYLPADGYHRIVALMKLGRKSIPALVEEEPLGEGEMIRKGLVANAHRVENTPLEKAEAIDRLMGLTGWNASTVAEKLGFSNATVSRLLSLLELPEPIREQVHRGDISLSAASELARVEDPGAQASLAADVASGRLTRDALSGSLRSRRRKPTPGGVAAAGPSRITARLGGGRTVSVVGGGIDLEAFIEALEEVLAKARKARTQGIEAATFAKMLKDQAG